MKTKERVTFRDWLFAVGTGQAMVLLGVSEATIRNWRIGRFLPRAEQMVKIKKASRGKVSIDQMVSAHMAFRKESEKSCN
jgi:DNA-binding transcriptional regulator YdaS (Cro superfamily)